jgi:hypothetical protein
MGKAVMETSRQWITKKQKGEWYRGWPDNIVRKGNYLTIRCLV